MHFEDSHNDESQIVLKAIEGDKQAFGLLYEAYAPSIYKYFVFKLAPRELAEDMTTAVFIKAWEALPSFNKQGRGLNFRSWLYRIAHNLLVDFYRIDRENLSIDQISEIQDSSFQPESGSVQNEAVAEIVQAVNQLDEKSGQVIINRFVSGLTHKETAKLMRLSEKNVRVIQFRALKKLKKLLDESYE